MPLEHFDMPASTAPPPVDLAAAMRHVSAEVETRFAHYLASPGDARDSLYAAMRHAALGGGKRLRPLLVWAATRLYADRVGDAAAIQVGAAIEAIHVYSLIHDDLPAMDDDDLRRGKPTVHKAFDEATAILAGDGLQTLAFSMLCDPRVAIDAPARVELVAMLAEASGIAGMVGGQRLDIAAEGQALDLGGIARMQALKTGALFGFAVEAGAVLAGAPGDDRAALAEYAAAMGFSFQIADDLLDATGDSALAGKATGKDAAAGKATTVSLLGLEGAREHARALCAQACGALDRFGPGAGLLRAIAHYVVERDR